MLWLFLDYKILTILQLKTPVQWLSLYNTKKERKSALSFQLIRKNAVLCMEHRIAEGLSLEVSLLVYGA